MDTTKPYKNNNKIKLVTGVSLPL